MKNLFGERLQQIRKAQCISQKEVVEGCDIPQSTIAHIEGGKYIPKKDVIERLAHYFHINAYWLETGNGQPIGNLQGKLFELNKCRSRRSEDEALKLLSLESSKVLVKVLLYEPDQCLICESYFRKYIIIYLCKPYDLKDLLERVKVFYIGKTDAPTDIYNIKILESLLGRGSVENILANATSMRNVELILSSLRTLLNTNPTFTEALYDFLKTYLKPLKQK